MSEILRSVQRAWEVFTRAAGPLLFGGLVWTGLNLFTADLLAGPALVGLFTIALKTHQGRRADMADCFAAFDDVAAPLVAGFLLVLPFSALPGSGIVSAVILASLCAWFSVFAFVPLVLADRGELGLRGAIAAAWKLAEGRPAAGRVSALAVHLLFSTAVLALLSLSWALHRWSLVFVGPLAACLLTAWYGQREYPAEASAEDTDATEEAEAPAAPPRPKKTVTRRRAAKKKASASADEST